MKTRPATVAETSEYYEVVAKYTEQACGTMAVSKRLAIFRNMDRALARRGFCTARGQGVLKAVCDDRR